MSNNIVEFKKKVNNEGLIKVIEDMLEHAKRGEIRSIITLMETNERTFVRGIYIGNKEISYYTTIGVLDSLKDEFKDMLSEYDSD
jgi:hypothetical protein